MTIDEPSNVMKVFEQLLYCKMYVSRVQLHRSTATAFKAF